MDLQTIRLLATEEELNSLLGEHVPEDSGVKDLRLVLTPQGVQLSGRYTTMLLPIAFESLWELSVAAEKIEARLANIKVAGFPATKLRGVLLGMLADSIAGQAGIQVQGDVIQVDLNQVMQARDIPVRLLPRTIQCTQGSLVFEGGL